jgi:ribonuclease VapC
MIVDSSAVLAVIFAEGGYEKVLAELTKGSPAAIAAPTVAEAGIVLSARLGTKSAGIIERFLQEFRIDVVPFAEAHVGIAVEAYRRYGKGHHAAALNFGDCIAYAVAKLADAPLLYVGNDFKRTDIRAAMSSE